MNDSYLDSFLSKPSILLRCPDCGFAFVESLPTEDKFFEKLYSSNDRDVSIDFNHSGKRKIFSEVISTLKSYVQPQAKLLDVGAGTGAFVSAASKDFTSSGIELSSACVAFAKSKNLPVSSTSFYDLNPSTEQYDVITLIDVLEHLTDPKKAVLKLKSVLKPNGFLYIKVPNYPAQALKQDILRKLGLSKAGIMQDYVHINHFTLKSLSSFLSMNGFDIIESGYSTAEIWDLKWKKAPKSLLYRSLYNFIVLSLTKVLNLASRLTGQSLGLNFYVLAQTKK